MGTHRGFAAGRAGAVAMLALLLVLAWTPAIASATRVSVGTGWVDGDEFSDGYSYVDVTTTGAAHERNDLRIAAARGSLEVQDARAPVTASSTCRRLSLQHVRCALTSDDGDRVAVTVLAGDGADRVAVGPAPTWLFLYGGSGDDVLSAPSDTSGLLADGGSGDDLVIGGAGIDELFGGAGNDRVVGGAGDDRLYGDGVREGRGSDSIDGGPGRDQVSYADHRRPVTIDLAAGRATTARERDTLVGIEDAQGGSGADRVAGDGRDNELEGMDGNDRVEGRGGDDVLSGGGIAWLTTGVGEGTIGAGVASAAEDRLSGGAGADRLAGGRVSNGGAGNDICAGTGTPQEPQRVPGCEWWTPAEDAAAEARIATTVRTTTSGVEITATGTYDLTVASADAPGNVLAGGSVAITGRRPTLVTLPFAPGGAEALAREPRPAEVLVTRPGSGSALLNLS